MIFLIIAQGARVGVIWVGSKLARKVLSTVVVVSIGGYLIQRHKEYKEKQDGRN